MVKRASLFLSALLSSTFYWLFVTFGPVHVSQEPNPADAVTVAKPNQPWKFTPLGQFIPK